jgi:hypothetical protein
MEIDFAQAAPFPDGACSFIDFAQALFSIEGAFSIEDAFSIEGACSFIGHFDALPDAAVNDTTKETKSKTINVFFTLSNIRFSIIFHS